MSRAGFSAVALALGLMMVACGGDSADQTTTPGGDQDTTTVAADTSTSAASGGATASMTIANFDFSGPDSIEAGTTMTVTNEDGVSHTFTSEDDVFDSDALGSGESFEFTFDEPGDYAYFCKFHPQMTGTLTVEG